MRNRGIGRARMFMGAALLLAATITWGIGLMMNPHGDAVAKGTDYLRSTIVTFKRNGAIGTLVLVALSAWMLFPARRPKWPARDWALIGLLAFLAGTSVFTLGWMGMSGPRSGKADANLAAVDDDPNANAAPPDANMVMTASPMVDLDTRAIRNAMNSADSRSINPMRMATRSSTSASPAPSSAADGSDAGSSNDQGQGAGNEADQNQE